MKKIVLALLLISFLVLPTIGLAVDNCFEIGDAATCEATRGCTWDVEFEACFAAAPVRNADARNAANDLPEVAPEIDLIQGITLITDIIFTLLIVTAVIFVLLGAFEFLTAGGDTEKVAKGRERILWAIIAVVVALLARGIIRFIVDRLYRG